MIVDQGLAARIEWAEAEFITACVTALGRGGESTFTEPLAGGMACYAPLDSPFTKVVGVGFAGLPPAGDLDAVEARYAAHGGSASFEISTLADPAVFELLTERGYRLLGFEDVLICDLGAAAASRQGDIAVEVAGDVELWLSIAVESALTPDEIGVAQLDQFSPDVLLSAERAGLDAGAVPYLARVGGRAAGAGSVHLAGEFAQLTGAGTLPAFRRRGVQRELIRRRLHDAERAGARYALVTTQPGSSSQANVRRSGFELAYSRAVLARPV